MTKPVASPDTTKTLKIPPDCPEEDRVAVVLTAGRFAQVVNRRVFDRTLEEHGVEIPFKVVKHRMHDRFFLDRRDLPRLLKCGGVELIENVEERAALEAQVAELEAAKAKVEATIAGTREEALERARQLEEEETRLAVEKAEEDAQNANAPA